MSLQLPKQLITKNVKKCAYALLVFVLCCYEILPFPLVAAQGIPASEAPIPETVVETTAPVNTTVDIPSEDSVTPTETIVTTDASIIESPVSDSSPVESLPIDTVSPSSDSNSTETIVNDRSGELTGEIVTSGSVVTGGDEIIQEITTIQTGIDFISSGEIMEADLGV